MSDAPTVLILEDHPNLLVHSVGLVEDAGYTALATDRAAEATTLLVAHQEIRAVFADLDAPGCDTLLADLRHRWPAVRLILTATGVNRSSPRIPKGAAFFPKPFTSSDIETTLKRYAA